MLSLLSKVSSCATTNASRRQISDSKDRVSVKFKDLFVTIIDDREVTPQFVAEDHSSFRCRMNALNRNIMGLCLGRGRLLSLYRAASSRTPALTIFREFSSDSSKPSTEWIPPRRPLGGENVSSDNRGGDFSGFKDEEEELRYIEEEIRKLEADEGDLDGSPVASHAGQVDNAEPIRNPNAPDWLQTRRARLRNQGVPDFLTPSQAARRKEEASAIPVKEYTMLTKDEIATCIHTLGGQDIKVILDNPLQRRMGGPLGIIIATVPTATQRRVIADTLVRQMRKRKLHEFDVVGAQLGAEGTEDPEARWIIVDCRNYVVHFQDEKTRKALKLEALWSGEDPLHNINPLDENAVEDYLAANPVPDDYGPTVTNWDETLKQIEKKRWSIPHRPVVPRKLGTKRRR